MAILMVAALSCSKDGGGDPEGTMNKTLMSHDIITGGGSTLKLGSTEVFMSRTENLWIQNGEIAYVGQVKGLGDVKKIPQSGWSTEAAATPNAGYVVRLDDGTYCRIFVSDVRSELYQGKACYTCTYYVTRTRYIANIKYQYPFNP